MDLGKRNQKKVPINLPSRPPINTGLPWGREIPGWGSLLRGRCKNRLSCQACPLLATSQSAGQVATQLRQLALVFPGLRPHTPYTSRSEGDSCSPSGNKYLLCSCCRCRPVLGSGDTVGADTPWPYPCGTDSLVGGRY